MASIKFSRGSLPELKADGSNVTEFFPAFKNQMSVQGGIDAAGLIDQCLPISSPHHAEFIYKAVGAQSKDVVSQLPKPPDGIVYPSQYTGDPFQVPRKKTHQDHWLTVVQQERVFVQTIGGGASFLHELMEKPLQARLESNAEYMLAKTLFRIDVMKNLIVGLLANNNGLKVVKKDCSIMIYNDFAALLKFKIKEGETVEEYLLRFQTKLTKLTEQGFYNNPPDDHDYVDYLLGQAIVNGISVPKFAEFITKAAHAEELESPTCTYKWAVEQARKWNASSRNVALVKSFGGGQNSAKIAQMSAEIEKLQKIAKRYNHEKSSNSERNLKRKGEKEDNGADVKKLKTPENRKCLHCGSDDHWATKCPDASKSQKAEYWKSFRAGKSAK